MYKCIFAKKNGHILNNFKHFVLSQSINSKYISLFYQLLWASSVYTVLSDLDRFLIRTLKDIGYNEHPDMILFI